MSACGYKVQLTDTGEILQCVMDEHPEAKIHSSEEAEFRKICEDMFMVRYFADGLRPVREGAEA